MRIAIVGCGFVADYYLQTLPLHPELELLGVTDKNAVRLKQFADYYDIVGRYESLEALLHDNRVEMVLNLTNPRNHYEVSLACLRAGKHVYTEKPLAIQLEQARALVEEAESRNLQIISAPCNLLGESAQTLWKVLRDGSIGKPLLAYANMDDNRPFMNDCHLWRSQSGAPWPYRDEFDIGVILEHAGYVITWLAAFFGPAKTVTSVSACLISNKVPGETLDATSPDIAITSILFSSGVIARITCSLIADVDRSLHIYGDISQNPLICADVWRYDAPVYTGRRYPKLPRTLGKVYRKIYSKRAQKKYPLIRKPKKYKILGDAQMDFACGPAELAASVREGRTCRLSPRFCLHVNEIVLAMSNAGINGSIYQTTTTFDPIEPMIWAKNDSILCK